MKHRYEVIVGNIGTVYAGGIARIADQKFVTYRQKSIDNDGRAAGESVTLLRNGEIDSEYIGTVDQDEEEI